MLGTAALTGYWQDVPSNTTIIGQEFINVIGYETPANDNANGAYIELSTKQGLTPQRNIVLNRDGFMWEGATGDDPVEIKIDGCIARDTTGGEDPFTIAPVSTNLWGGFVFDDDYYNAQEDVSFSSTVSFVSAAYSDEILNTFDSNGFPLQVSGTVSDVYQSSSNTYKYLFNGSTIYLAKQGTDGSWNVGRVYGFPVNCSAEYTVSQSGNVCTLMNGSTPVSIPVNKSVIVYNTSSPLSTQLVGDGAIYTNTEAEAKSTFTSDYSINQYKARICDYYVSREGVITDYSNQQIAKYRFSGGSIDTANPVYELQPDGGLIVVPIYNVTDEDLPTPNYYFMILPKLDNLYSISSSPSDATITRYWEYSDANGSVKQISDRKFRERVVGGTSWPNWDGWDSWTWPIWNAQIDLNLFYMYSTGEVDPSFFDIRYKNQGEDVQDLVFSQDEDLQWKASGLASLDMSGDKACELYKNQKLYLTAKDVSAEDNIDFESGYEMWFEQQVNQDEEVYYDAYIKYPDETVEVIEDVKHLYMCASDDLYVEGYDSVNLELIDSSGYTYYPTILFTFDKYSPSANYKKGVYPNKKVIFRNDFDGSMQFELPDSTEHIFTIRNYQTFEQQSTSLGTSGLYIGTANGLSCLTVSAENGVYDLSQKGVYQFRISGVNELTLPITLIDDNTEEQDTVRSIRVEVEPIVAVDGASGIFSFNYNPEEFINTLKEYSYVNGKNAFNFFCVPDPNKRIDDPLESTSFNNHNHFYNGFTICKVREYNILGKSNIFVNN